MNVNEELRKDGKPSKKSSRPARLPENREARCISLAIDLAEKKLMDGSAGPQIICHYLKLGSEREKKEIEILEEKKKLYVAKTEALESAKHMEEMYEQAMNALKGYRGEE